MMGGGRGCDVAGWVVAGRPRQDGWGQGLEHSWVYFRTLYSDEQR
jgi:hypothetical protein